MVRPITTEPTIVVAVDNELLVWTEGLLSGTSRELIDATKKASHYGYEVNLTPFGPTVVASLDNLDAPEQVVAAMLSAGDGRGRIIEAPQTVLDLLPFDEELTDSPRET